MDTDHLLNDLLQRKTPFPADLREIENALRNASHEVLFIVDSRNRVVATVPGGIHEVQLTLKIQRAMRRRITWHSHPSGNGPSIEDIVGGIGRGDRRQLIVTSHGIWNVDFGNISRLPANQREKIATLVQRQIDRILSDRKFVRWSWDDLLNHAMEQAAQKQGFTVTFTRQNR